MGYPSDQGVPTPVPAEEPSYGGPTSPRSMPPADDCEAAPQPPSSEGPDPSGSPLDLNVSSLLSVVDDLAGDIGTQGVSVKLLTTASSDGDDCPDNDTSGGIAVDIGAPVISGGENGIGLDLVGRLVGVGDDDGGLISFDGNADALVNLTVSDGDAKGGGLFDIDLSGSAASHDSNALIDVALDGTLTGGDSATDGGLLSLQQDGNALINIPLLGDEGGVGSLLNAAMLNVGTTGEMSFQQDDCAYDGNVALAGDLSAALGSTLDILTTSSSLFDVPALDFLVGDGLDG